MRVEPVGSVRLEQMPALQLEQLYMQRDTVALESVTLRPRTGDMTRVRAQMVSESLDWSQLRVGTAGAGPWISGVHAAQGARVGLAVQLLNLVAEHAQSGGAEPASADEPEVTLQVLLLALTYRGDQPLGQLGPYWEENPFRVEAILPGTLLDARA